MRQTARPEHTPATTIISASSRRCPGLTIFFAYRLQHPVLQQRLGQHLLELAVFPLQFLESSGFLHLQLPKLLLPPVKTHLGDVVFPTHFEDRLARVRLPQNADLVFGCIPLAFHSGSFLSAQTNISSGSKKRSHVKAIDYVLKRWEALTQFVDDGLLEIDNNLIENAIRPSAIGKKNWLFIGHPEAGDRSAVIYTLLGSCRRQGINPYDYLKDLFTRLPAAKITEIGQFTPAAWARQRRRRN